MGYRSEVTIAIKKETFIKHSLLAANIPLILIEEQRHEFEDNYYWNMQSIKWYESFEDVAAVNTFIDNLIDHDSESAAMSRVGEEIHDVEEIGDTYAFDIQIEAYIHRPF
jgi:hypothetical protein